MNHNFRMMTTIVGMVVALTLSGAVAWAQESTLEIYASADALIAHGVDVADPTGNAEYAEVGTRPSSNAGEDRKGYMRLLVRFDLADLPANAQITSAKLRLRRAHQKEQGEGLEDETITVSAYRLLKDWTEGRPDGAAWSWAKRKELNWGEPGADATQGDNADRAASPTDTVNALDFSTGVYNVWDVTSDVTAMVAGKAENHGWILIGPEVSQGSDWVRYRTRENAQASGKQEYCPVLQITYELPAESQASNAPASDVMQLRPAKGEVVPTLTEENMLSNGDFDLGLDYWSISLGEGVVGGCDVMTTEYGSVLRVTRSAGDGPMRIISEPVEVTPDTSYLLTGLYQTSTASFGSMAEFHILQSTEPEMANQMDVLLNAPARYGHIGHRTLFNRPEGEWERKTRTFRTYAQTRYIRLAITLEGNASTVLFDNIYLGKPQPDNRQWSWPAREQPQPREQVMAALQARPDSTAQVKPDQGTPKLHIDGKPVVPQFHMTDIIKPARGFIREFAEHGIDIHMVTLFNVSQKHWFGQGQYDFDKIDEIMWNAVSRDPNGHFVIYINLLPYSDWHKEFPQHAAQNSAGQYATSRHDHYAPPSYWSPEYRRQTLELLEAYVTHIKKQPYSRAVVGYFLGGGEDGQFYYQVVSGQKTLQDGNAPGARPLLASWLREKYSNEQALRDAWGDAELTYENVRPPIQNKRYSGTFFDPATQRSIADFQSFLNEELARFLNDMARVCKETAGKPIVVGAYYGRGNSFMVYPHFAQTSVMFDSPYIDYMGAQPGYYGYRENASIGHFNWVMDSLRLHNKIPMSELDFRTWVSQFKSMDHDFKVARYWHLDELRAAVERDAGKMLSANGGAWWMEMSGGWFSEPTIMAMLEQVKTASQSLYESKATFSPADIVFVTDENSFFWTNEQVNIWNGPTYHAVNVQQHAIYRAGIKFDHYYLSDLIDREMDDYKVYIFLNLYYQDEKTRSFIENHLKRDNKVLVWQYAPGYLTADGFSTSAMAELTGMHFATDAGERHAGLRSRFVADAEGELARQLAVGSENKLLGLGMDLPAQRFVVDDEDAQVFAAYVSDSKPAAAIKQLDQYTSVFVGHPSGFTPGLLQNIARLAGAHVFVEPGDMFMYHRDDLIVMHGIEGGSKTISLPFKADIVDVFSGKTLASNEQTVTINLKPGETRWLKLKR